MKHISWSHLYFLHKLLMKTNDLSNVISVWVDVSKAKLNICLMTSAWANHIVIENSKKWIEWLYTYLSTNLFSKQAPIVVESTGQYHLMICLILSKDFNVKLINPIMTKQATRYTVRNTKTDTTDAELLANMWIVGWYKLHSYNDSITTVHATKLMNTIESIEHNIQSLRATLASYSTFCNEQNINENECMYGIKKTIIELEKQKIKLQNSLTISCEKTPYWSKIKQLASIPWISERIATMLVIWFWNHEFKNKNQLYAFTWYDPKLKQSGQSALYGRISKRWNPYIRKILYQASFWLRMNYPRFKSRYNELKQQWKHHWIASTILIKKLVHMIWSIWNSWNSFSQEIFELHHKIYT